MLEADNVRFEVVQPQISSPVIPKSQLVLPFFNATRDDALTMSLNLFRGRDRSLNLFLSSSSAAKTKSRELFAVPSSTSLPVHRGSLPNVPRPDVSFRTANAAIMFLEKFDLYLIGMESDMYYHKFYVARALNESWIRLPACKSDMASYFTWTQSADAIVHPNETFFFGAMDTSISLFEGNDEEIYMAARATISWSPRHYHHRGKRATGIFLLSNLKGAIRAALGKGSSRSAANGECVVAKRKSWWGPDADLPSCNPQGDAPLRLLNISKTERLLHCVNEIGTVETSEKRETPNRRKQRVQQVWKRIVGCFGNEVPGESRRKEFRSAFRSILDCSTRVRKEIYSNRVSRISSDFYVGAVAMYERGSNPVHLLPSKDGLVFDQTLMGPNGKSFIMNLTSHFSTSEVVLADDNFVTFFSNSQGVARALWSKYRLGAVVCRSESGTCNLTTKLFKFTDSVVIRGQRVGADAMAAFRVIANQNPERSCSKPLGDRAGNFELEIDCPQIISLESYLFIEFSPSVRLHSLEIR